MVDTGPGPIDARPKRSALRIFVYVLVGLGALAVGSCGVVAYLAWQDPDFRGLVESAVESQSGPGHDALTAAGCQTALAIDLERALALAERMAGEQAEAERVASRLVQCETAPDNPRDLDCARVARLYADAESPAEPFVVIVSAAGEREEICSVLADPSGEVIGDFEESFGGEPAP